MTKTTYKMISVIAALALTFGAYSYAGASSTITPQIDTAALSSSVVNKSANISQAVLQTQSTRMLIPLYIYPSAGTWANVVNANTYKNIDVIINPNNGPTASIDANYVMGVNQLRAGSVGIYGYVYSSWGTRSLAVVKMDIDNWKLWYGVDGIFIDEADNTSAMIPYYTDLWNYITAKGMKVILNPGTNTIESYVPIADTNVIYESDPSKALTVPSWFTNYSASKFGFLQYGATVDQMRTFVPLAKSKNIGFIYVTDATVHFWSSLPSYLNEEAALLANVSALPAATMTATGVPTITPTAPLVKTTTPVPFTPTMTAPVVVNSPTSTPIPVTPTTASVGQNTIEVRVAKGLDDVEESATGSMYVDSSDLELVYDGSNQVVGIRFAGVNIPKGAIITNAYLQFKVDETSSSVTTLSVQGEASSNAAVFASTSRNVSSRMRTTSITNWSPSSWMTLKSVGTEQRTPNLSSIVQEIVNQPAWVSGNSMVMIIAGNGNRVAEAYEVDPAGAPLLHVEYSMPTSMTNTPAMTNTPTQIVMATSTQTPTLTPTTTLAPFTQVPSTSTMTAPVVVNSPTSTPIPAIPTTASLGQNTIEVRVAKGLDDVEESATGSMYVDSSDLELVYDGSNQVVGIRFAGVNIPKGAIITNAYLQFKVDETSSSVTALSVQGEASSNAAAFASTSRNVSSRVRTTSIINWSPPSWPTLKAAGSAQRTPNLASVVQEIVNQTAWVSGNSMVMIITGSGKRTARSYEVDHAGAPLLHIEYSMPSTATVTPTQTITLTPTASPTNTLMPFTATSTIPVIVNSPTPEPATATPIPGNTDTPAPTESIPSTPTEVPTDIPATP